MIVNVLLARVLLRLCWNAELMSTGGFFGDKGPNYDEERVRTPPGMSFSAGCWACAWS